MNNPPASGLRRKWKAVVIGVLTLLAAMFGLAEYMGLLGENFREINAKCYRSGQLSTESLESHIHQQHIGCVINLRGFCKEPWYEKELKVCAANHVEHADFKIDPVRLPRPEVLHDLIHCFKTNTPSLLMHCRNGSDRTGLAATLYEMVMDKKSVQNAVDMELSWRYGHFRSSKNDAAERFFELYEKNSGGADIETWIDTSYPALYASVGPYGPPVH